MGLLNRDFGFKFKIGQTVEHIGSHPIRNKDKKIIMFSRKQKLFIVGRLLDECPGGVQRHYDVRAILGDSSLATNLVRFNEIELKEFIEEEEFK
jgi:hypothetical protein